MIDLDAARRTIADRPGDAAIGVSCAWVGQVAAEIAASRAARGDCAMVAIGVSRAWVEQAMAEIAAGRAMQAVPTVARP